MRAAASPRGPTRKPRKPGRGPASNARRWPPPSARSTTTSTGWRGCAPSMSEPSANSPGRQWPSGPRRRASAWKASRANARPWSNCSASWRRPTRPWRCLPSRSGATSMTPRRWPSCATTRRPRSRPWSRPGPRSSACRPGRASWLPRWRTGANAWPARRPAPSAAIWRSNWLACRPMRSASNRPCSRPPNWRRRSPGIRRNWRSRPSMPIPSRACASRSACSTNYARSSAQWPRAYTTGCCRASRSNSTAWRWPATRRC
ncbi:Uncharacterised protein [Bordetella pertussis]|nr:Uncharacterised protein [Bordetella pertussis]CFN42894.1 Uncharacterised protein [Bordetella pertussis]CFN99225.1 Uncharacterised protein [Bordetella pertussis]CFP13098.1 Uncharacterised protein [Bordetella pertussis]CFP16036.1 Uncharacterised protein [Bordetella pertussis]